MFHFDYLFATSPYMPFILSRIIRDTEKLGQLDHEMSMPTLKSSMRCSECWSISICSFDSVQLQPPCSVGKLISPRTVHWTSWQTSPHSWWWNWQQQQQQVMPCYRFLLLNICLRDGTVFSEANSRAAIQIFLILWNRKIHYRVQIGNTILPDESSPQLQRLRIYDIVTHLTIY
jgi:hypothetical protein